MAKITVELTNEIGKIDKAVEKLGKNFEKVEKRFDGFTSSLGRFTQAMDRLAESKFFAAAESISDQPRRRSGALTRRLSSEAEQSRRDEERQRAEAHNANLRRLYAGMGDAEPPKPPRPRPPARDPRLPDVYANVPLDGESSKPSGRRGRKAQGGGESASSESPRPGGRGRRRSGPIVGGRVAQDFEYDPDIPLMRATELTPIEDMSIKEMIAYRNAYFKALQKAQKRFETTNPREYSRRKILVDELQGEQSIANVVKYVGMGPETEDIIKINRILANQENIALSSIVGEKISGTPRTNLNLAAQTKLMRNIIQGAKAKSIGLNAGGDIQEPGRVFEHMMDPRFLKDDGGLFAETENESINAKRQRIYELAAGYLGTDPETIEERVRAYHAAREEAGVTGEATLTPKDLKVIENQLQAKTPNEVLQSVTAFEKAQAHITRRIRKAEVLAQGEGVPLPTEGTEGYYEALARAAGKDGVDLVNEYKNLEALAPKYQDALTAANEKLKESTQGITEIKDSSEEWKKALGGINAELAQTESLMNRLRTRIEIAEEQRKKTGITTKEEVADRQRLLALEEKRKSQIEKQAYAASKAGVSEADKGKVTEEPGFSDMLLARFGLKGAAGAFSAGGIAGAAKFGIQAAALYAAYKGVTHVAGRMAAPYSIDAGNQMDKTIFQSGLLGGASTSADFSAVRSMAGSATRFGVKPTDMIAAMNLSNLSTGNRSGAVLSAALAARYGMKPEAMTDITTRMQRLSGIGVAGSDAAQMQLMNQIQWQPGVPWHLRLMGMTPESVKANFPQSGFRSTAQSQSDLINLVKSSPTPANLLYGGFLSSRYAGTPGLLGEYGQTAAGFLESIQSQAGVPMGLGAQAGALGMLNAMGGVFQQNMPPGMLASLASAAVQFQTQSGSAAEKALRVRGVRAALMKMKPDDLDKLSKQFGFTIDPNSPFSAMAVMEGAPSIEDENIRKAITGASTEAVISQLGGPKTAEAQAYMIREFGAVRGLQLLESGAYKAATGGAGSVSPSQMPTGMAGILGLPEGASTKQEISAEEALLKVENVIGRVVSTINTSLDNASIAITEAINNFQNAVAVPE